MFSARGKEKFGCNEVINQDPSRPEDQRSWVRTAIEVEGVQARMETRHLEEIERKKIQKEMEIDPEMHPSRTSFWFAPLWDKRKAPTTPLRRDYAGNGSDSTLREPAKQTEQVVREGTPGSNSLDRDERSQLEDKRGARGPGRPLLRNP